MGALEIMYRGNSDLEVPKAKASNEVLSLVEDILEHKIIVVTDCQQVVRSTHDGPRGV